MPNSHTRRRTKSCETRCAFPPRASCATCKSPTVKPVIPNQKLFNRPANPPRPRKSLPSPLSAFLEDGLGRTIPPHIGRPTCTERVCQDETIKVVAVYVKKQRDISPKAV